MRGFINLYAEGSCSGVKQNLIGSQKEECHHYIQFYRRELILVIFGL